MWIAWDEGVDWVTTSANRDFEHFDAQNQFCVAELRRAQRDGHTLKPASRLGYSGFTAGPVFWGEREDGIMCQVSGSYAHQFACRLAEEPYCAKVTRIDLQVTARAETDQPGHARAIYEALAANGMKGAKGRDLSARLFVSKKTGDALEIGHRSSSRFCRIYDKTRQQKGKVQEGLWRYEVEFKAKQARQIWQRFRDAGNVLLFTVDIVRATFISRGVNMDWCDGDVGQKLPSTYNKTDTERQLGWCEKVVARTARELVAKGHEDFLRETFNLPRASVAGVLATGETNIPKGKGAATGNNGNRQKAMAKKLKPAFRISDIIT